MGVANAESLPEAVCDDVCGKHRAASDSVNAPMDK